MKGVLELDLSTQNSVDMLTCALELSPSIPVIMIHDVIAVLDVDIVE